MNNIDYNPDMAERDEYGNVTVKGVARKGRECDDNECYTCSVFWYCYSPTYKDSARGV